MNRQQKEVIINNLRDSLGSNQALFLLNYQGLRVDQMQDLRKKLRNAGGKFQVAKARLVRLAADEFPQMKDLSVHLKNQISLAFAEKDPAAIVKVIDAFSKSNAQLQVVAGYMDSMFLDSAMVKRIALLPSREVLLAQVCGAIKAPLTGLVIVLRMMVLRLLWTLKQIGEKKSA